MIAFQKMDCRSLCVNRLKAAVIRRFSACVAGAGRPGFKKMSFIWNLSVDGMLESAV